MYAELIGEVVDYSSYEPFVLETIPEDESNRTLRFSSTEDPLYKVAQLMFEEETSLCH